MLLPRRLASAIITLVSIVWALNFALQFIPGINYHPDLSINGIFMGIVGGALALSRKGGDHSDPGRQIDPPDQGDPSPGRAVSAIDPADRVYRDRAQRPPRGGSHRRPPAPPPRYPDYYGPDDDEGDG